MVLLEPDGEFRLTAEYLIEKYGPKITMLLYDTSQVLLYHSEGPSRECGELVIESATI